MLNVINQYPAGFIPADNMRFRDHGLTFKVKASHVVAHTEGEEGEKKLYKVTGEEKVRRGYLT